MDKVKQKLKQFGKFLLKSKILKIVIPVVLITFAILSAVLHFFTLLDGVFNADDKSNVPNAAHTYTTNVKFTDKGIRFLYTDEESGQESEKTSEEMAQIMWDQLIKEGSTVNNYLNNVDELRKLMEAEVITQYPKLDGNVDLNGTIEIKRNKTDGTKIKLQYTDLDTFNNFINNKDTNIVNYYTLDESQNILVGVVDKTTETINSDDEEFVLSEYSESMTDEDLNGEGSYTRTEYSVYSKPINYKNVISKYTMPFQYLWSIIVAGDDAELGLELADLVKDSYIELSIFDNITTTTTTSTYTYNKENKIDVTATATAKTKDKGDFTKTENFKPVVEWQEDDCLVQQVNVYENNIPIVDITEADVWIVYLKKEYDYQKEQSDSSYSNERDLEETEYEGDDKNPYTSTTGEDLPYYDKFKDKINKLCDEAESLAEGSSIESSKITYCRANYYKRIANRKQKDENQSNSQKYIAGNVTNNPKINKKTPEEIKNGTGQTNFVTIMCDEKHKDARFKITDEITLWFIELLEKNPDTVNMVELTKYLINQVLGKEKFDTDFTFDEFENNVFSGSATIYGNNFEEKVWFAMIDAGYSEYATAGAMGNFMQESGFKSNNMQNSYESKLGMNDESYTAGVNNGTYTNFVNDGVGYGLAQWTYPSRKENLYRFAKENGVGIDDEDMQINFLFKELQESDCPKWKSATSVEDACYYFEKEFEKAGNPQMGNRLTYAQDIYTRYHGQQAPTGANINLSGESKSKMQALLQEAQRIANDNRYTYSQDNRYGQFQYDCSSLVSRLYSQFFGISVPATTDAYGSQYRVGPSTSVELQPGDVLWRKGHVTLYIGNGLYVAAHSSKLPPDKQIDVYNDNPSKYTYVYRFITN